MGIITRFSEVSYQLKELVKKLEEGELVEDSSEIGEGESEFKVSLNEYLDSHESFKEACLELKAVVEYYENDIQRLDEAIGNLETKKERLNKKQQYFKDILKYAVKTFGTPKKSKTTGNTSYSLDLDIVKMGVSPSENVDVKDAFLSESNWEKNKDYLFFTRTLKNLTYDDLMKVKELLNTLNISTEDKVTPDKTKIKETIRNFKSQDTSEEVKDVEIELEDVELIVKENFKLDTNRKPKKEEV